MERKKLLRELFPSSLLIMAVALAAVLWFGERHFSKVVYRHKAAGLEVLARIAGRQISELAKADAPGEVESAVHKLCGEFGALSRSRVTVVLPSGRVIGDTSKNPGDMDNHAGRPEVREALAGNQGVAVRHSSTVDQKMMYVAAPLDTPELQGVVRIAVPVTTIAHDLRIMQFRMVLAGVVVVVIGGGLGLMISRRVVRPLEEMKRGVERFARGDLESRLPVPASEELGSFADAMNEMASQLDERLRTAVQQRNEMEAVLSSMVEGVIAIDTDKHIISMNQAAAKLLGVDQAAARGKIFFEIVRNSALLDFISETLDREKPMEREIELTTDEERFLQIHGSMLADAQSRTIGALVVLNDVTRIRHLESVRRDFVLNASHEIRTPVTSIKGFVETLLEGALDDRENVERFLRIIARHADRLNAIVEDLLNLSRTEREAERGEIPFHGESLGAVVREAVEVCRPAAQRRDIILEQTCPGDIRAEINASLLVQAVINLVDNAIKYSDPGKEVKVSCRVDGPWAVVEVGDQGSGIAENHLPRLFERFYRVDKARSRSLGSTGLGLAIVKHIVQAHRGSVIVESELGQGSTFTIFLPLSRKEGRSR